jgi:PPP family 3-phenylpropionic acid transporter
VKGHAELVSGPIIEVLRQRKVLFLLGAGLFMTASHGALYVFYSIHLVAQGYGKTLVGALWTLGVVAEIVVFLLMPRISLRVSMRSILLACFLLAALRFLLIGWAPGFIGLLVVAQLLHGASFGAHHAATMAALNRWFAAGPAGAGAGLVRQHGLWGGGVRWRIAGRCLVGEFGCGDHLQRRVGLGAGRPGAGLARCSGRSAGRPCAIIAGSR